MAKWHVESGRHTRFNVEAEDQWGAYDELRDVLPAELGLVVEVWRDGTDRAEDAFACRTSYLMATRWGKPAVARAFIAHAIARGLPDTTKLDFPKGSR